MRNTRLGRLAVTFLRHRRTVRLTRELQSTSDRALADLGLARGDVADLAKGNFRRA